MPACDKGCTTVEDVVVRVARQLGDYTDNDPSSQFVTWTRAALVDYYNEATQMMVAHRPDAFAQTIEMRLVPGTRQKIPSGYREFVKVEDNLAASGAEAGAVVPGDEYFTKIMAKKACLPRGCASAQDDYVVRSFAKSSVSATEFTVSPPVPPGMSPTVRVSVVASPAKVCTNETGQCVGFDPVYASAVVEWMLYRAWSADAEIVGGTNAAAMHARMFFQMLGVQLQREQQYFSGAFRPMEPTTSRGRS